MNSRCENASWKPEHVPCLFSQGKSCTRDTAQTPELLNKLVAYYHEAQPLDRTAATTSRPDGQQRSWSRQVMLQVPRTLSTGSLHISLFGRFQSRRMLNLSSTHIPHSHCCYCAIALTLSPVRLAERSSIASPPFPCIVTSCCSRFTAGAARYRSLEHVNAATASRYSRGDKLNLKTREAGSAIGPLSEAGESSFDQITMWYAFNIDEWW